VHFNRLLSLAGEQFGRLIEAELADASLRIGTSIYWCLVHLDSEERHVYKRAIAAGAAAVSIGIAIAMAAVSPALAGPVSVKGITTHTVIATTTAAGTQTGEADATCGAGELLVGGGYVVNSTMTDWRIYVDSPLNGNTWLVEVVNFDAQPLSFSAYAICAKSKPGGTAIKAYTTQTVQTQVDVPANQTGEADATCPAGQLRTGGGYTVENVSSNWSVYSNAPLNSDTWNVEIDNEVPLTTTIFSFAQCLAKVNGKAITGLAVSTVDTAATAPANGAQSADVSCGAHQLMTGGGHVIDSVGQEWNIEASAPISSNDWRVTAADLDSNSRDFDSLAVCLAKA